MSRWGAVVGAGLLGGLAWGALAGPLPADEPGAKQEAERLDKLPPIAPAPAGHIDHSGRVMKGRASYYADRFANRTMADGRKMNPNTDVAASKTLPLGSVAKVTNLENGKTATVRIEDRGPYVAGRVVDLAPKVAGQLELGHKGVVPVEIKPITLPRPDGQVELGAGAAEASSGEVQQAVGVTKSLMGSKTTETADR